MLDIKYIREKAEEIKKSALQKNLRIDIDELLSLDDKRRQALAQIEDLRSQRNNLAKSGQNARPSQEQIEEGKRLKESIATLEAEFSVIEESYLDLMAKVPSITAPDVPIGRDETENIESERWGEATTFDFNPKSHIEIGEALDIIDFDRGAKVAGYRGYYMKNEGASLQLALMLFAFNKLISKGFTPIIPPTLVREFALFGSGYFAGRSYNSDQDEIYQIANDEKLADGSLKKENKFLVGTAEPSLLAYYADEVLDKKILPLRLVGFSQCYRSEIGSYGKDTKGIYRVHEFMKVEQVCLCEADIEQADALHQEMLAITKEIHEDLGLPYRVLRICTGDMSAGKYKMFDIEAWMPSRQNYGETGSASNFTDWQSRRLNVRYQDGDERKHVFMLNNTACPSPRMIIAILENFQQADGSILIPEPLRLYMPGNITHIKPKA